MSVVKAAVNTYSHAAVGGATTTTLSDWAWRAADLGLLRTTPMGAAAGAGIGAGMAQFEVMKGESEYADWSGYASVGALVGGGIGASLGMPGLIKFGADAFKVATSRAATAGFEGNTVAYGNTILGGAPGAISRLKSATPTP